MICCWALSHLSQPFLPAKAGPWTLLHTAFISPTEPGPGPWLVLGPMHVMWIWRPSRPFLSRGWVCVYSLCGTTIGVLPPGSSLQCDPCSFCAAPIWHHLWSPASMFPFTMRPMFLLCGSYVAPHWGPASLFPFTMRPMFLLCGSYVTLQNWGPASLFRFTMRPMFLLCGSYVAPQLGPCLPVPLYFATMYLLCVLCGTTIEPSCSYS